MKFSSFNPGSLGSLVAAVPVAGLLLMVSAGASAQDALSDAGPRRTVSIVPRLSITETVTDNVHLSNGNQQAEQITEVSPGIRIISDGARLKAYLDYSVNEVVYGKNEAPGQTQHALTSFGTLEAVDNWAYLDFGGSISQQRISAFGTPSGDNTSINPNRTEVSSYRLSPYLRGRWGDVANYEARISRVITSNDALGTSNLTTDDGVIHISGATAFRNLGWSADASRQSIEYSAGRSTDADQLSLGLTFVVTPQLSVQANAGNEANNYTDVGKESYRTSSLGVNWSPSEMTTLSAIQGHRSFGSTHSVSFGHRTARTMWKFSDTKGILETPGPTGIASLGAVYGLLYSQFAALESDPKARAQLVDAFLQTHGIDPTAAETSGFLTSAVSLQRRQDLLFALLGVRDVVTFMASRSEISRLDTISTAVDDFNTSALVRQRGFSVNYAHRLTPDYSIGLLASQQNTAGAASEQDTSLRVFNVYISGKVHRRATMAVGLRRVVFESATAPYDETAFIANLTVQF